VKIFTESQLITLFWRKIFETVASEGSTPPCLEMTKISGYADCW